MLMKVKYPRTAHLPWSLGRSSDDVVATDLSGFVDREIVVTEKMDGENTTLYHDGFHARSVDSRHHPSRDWLARFHAERAYMIPEGMRICGENLYAQHSIAYRGLPSYFLGFSVWQGDECLGWPETMEVFQYLSITAVPVLYRGPFDVAFLKDLVHQLDPERQEGYVVRTVRKFHRNDFGRYVQKFVRANHVQTDQHWQHQAVVPNQLGE
jgi:hypothetical protein